MEKQMKTQTAANLRRSFASLLAAGLLTAGSFSTAQAQEKTKTADADIKYAGTINNKLVFGVEYSNDNEQPFFVEVKDAEGYVFYSSRFKDKKFHKFFAIDKSELSKGSLVIQVDTKAGSQKQVFDINTTSRLVEDVNVSVVKL